VTVGLRTHEALRGAAHTIGSDGNRFGGVQETPNPPPTCDLGGGRDGGPVPCARTTSTVCNSPGRRPRASAVHFRVCVWESLQLLSRPGAFLRHREAVADVREECTVFSVLLRLSEGVCGQED